MCVVQQTVAEGSDRAAQKVAGRANRSWLAGSKTFTQKMFQVIDYKSKS